jgi:outer membrane receptor protein involved in Fe transport
VSWAASLVSERYREKNAGVGGVSDVSNGYAVHRDNWNLAVENVALPSGRQLNELRAQAGRQRLDQPPNSTAVSEWFSNGNTLASGGNLLGHLLADSREYEIRETWHATFAGERGTQDVKLGGSFRSNEQRQRIDLFQYGLFIYLNDTRDLPVTYLYGEGSSDVSYALKRYGLFLQDDWRPLPRLTLNLGVRYDLDDGGNHPGFTHPLVPAPRRRDTDDVQPRAAFSWDLSGDGRSVVRGGAGMFRGRTQGIAGIERQMNGITGYLIRTRVNGALFGLNAPPFVLDPSRPAATGILLPPDISLLAPTLETPESVQASLGWTRALPHGFFFEAEGLYSRGRKDLVIHNVNFGGNSNPVRLNPAYNQINVYSNAGRSEYRALILQLNGALENGDLLTASLTLGSRKYTADAKDYEPPFGYPSDPANLAAEYGRGRTDERLRCVLTGVFHLPWQLTLAPVYEYGSGQPWNRLLGYDWNGDGRISDRAAGVRRNDQDGPPFRQLDLRLTKSVALSGRQRLDLIVEGFNVFDTVNGDVTSIDPAEFLSGPTLQNPDLPYRPNPRFGKTRAAFPGRTIQLGLRWVL